MAAKKKTPAKKKTVTAEPKQPAFTFTHKGLIELAKRIKAEEAIKG